MPEPTRTHRVEITYCTGCRWMLRSAWYAQELLSTFEAELAEVALRPGSGGVFEVKVGPAAGPAELLWSRERDGGFPEIKLLKQRVRDAVSPAKDLGHSDKRAE
ncbi:SelT/SelW/SelH family protein [Pseudobythopirellula maris]|nr:SelT/SelW/SelH family protein [Pseudobythopirellula maris]